jgi:hypothetical protein
MCDYSLQGIRNRLAEQGEILVVHRFQTGSKGLTSPRYLQPVEKPKTWISALKQLFTVPAEECAVCIPDGAKMCVSGISASIQRRYGVSAEELVTFRQLSADAATYRDAVEFRNGQRARLQELDEGQQLEILALSSEEFRVLEDSAPQDLAHTRAMPNRNPW